MNLNKVFYGGRLARDPELRFTASNTPVCNFAVATNRRVKNKQTDKWEDAPPTFIDITAWGKTAENIQRFFGKGDEILVCGRLEVEEWEDRNTGSKRSKVKITAESFEFCGPKQDREQGAPPTRPAANTRPAPAGNGPSDEDIPF